MAFYSFVAFPLSAAVFVSGRVLLCVQWWWLCVDESKQNKRADSFKCRKRKVEV